MIGDRDLGKNWHLRFRKIIQKLKEKNKDFIDKTR